MPMIMIACPVSGKPVATGMAVDARSFESLTLTNTVIGPCPHCGRSHVWSKRYAYLEGQEPKPKPPMGPR